MRGCARLLPLVNPYGWRLYEHVWRYLTDSELLARIGEFQSFDFHAAARDRSSRPLILGIAGGTLALMLRRFHHFLLAMLFSVMALRSARALPLVALILLPIANSAITAVLPFKRFRLYCERLRMLDARMSGWRWLPCWSLIAPAQSAAHAGRADFPPDQFPVAATTTSPRMDGCSLRTSSAAI